MNVLMYTRDWEEWYFEQSVSKVRICLSAEGATNISWPGFLLFNDGIVWHVLVNNLHTYIYKLYTHIHTCPHVLIHL